VDELKENLRCGRAVSDQFWYSMLHRDPEQDILPFCAEHNLATLTYMSLQQGLLTGKISMDRVFQPTEFRSNRHWNAWFLPANRKRVLDLLASWAGLTRKYACSIAQLVIAWTLAQRGVTHTLVGARTTQQLKENAGAAGLRLEAGDLKRIRHDVVALGAPMTA
jgi:methylglyoxal reductase